MWKFLCWEKISFFEKSLDKFKLPKIRKFNKLFLNDIDIIFTALPNGEAQSISKNLLKISLSHTLIDLAADFRLEKSSEYLRWYKQKHKASKNIKRVFMLYQKYLEIRSKILI